MNSLWETRHFSSQEYQEHQEKKYERKKQNIHGYLDSVYLKLNYCFSNFSLQKIVYNRDLEEKKSWELQDTASQGSILFVIFDPPLLLNMTDWNEYPEFIEWDEFPVCLSVSSQFPFFISTS